MNKISLCMIVKNEEETLYNCLNSVYDCVDEIIIVDTGSTDLTKNIATAFTDKVYDFTWVNDFSLARNFGIEKASYNYIMWLDADDIVPSETANEINRLKNTFNADFYFMPYVLSRDKKGNPTFYYFRERIFKRNGNFFKGFVHEAVVPYGIIETINKPILHAKTATKHPKRNLEIYEYHINKGTTLDARSTFYYGRELFYNGKIDLAEEVLKKFLSMKNTYAPDIVCAYNTLAHIYKNRGEYEKSNAIIYEQLLHYSPTSETCCILGENYMALNNLPCAEFWFLSALNIKNQTGFINADYSGLIPCVWLSCVYDRLGDKGKALTFHEKAKGYDANNPSVKHNDKYFYS